MHQSYAAGKWCSTPSPACACTAAGQRPSGHEQRAMSAPGLRSHGPHHSSPSVRLCRAGVPASTSPFLCLTLLCALGSVDSLAPSLGSDLSLNLKAPKRCLHKYCSIASPGAGIAALEQLRGVHGSAGSAPGERAKPHSITGK